MSQAPPTTSTAQHPVVVAINRQRAEDAQLRIADGITKFAGSMWFVYVHALLFAAWMLFFEKAPWQTLTLVVSLEAIFLSTFVMIGQNRAATFAQAKADHDFNEQELELKTNTDLTRQIHVLTTELHRRVMAAEIQQLAHPAEHLRQPEHLAAESTPDPPAEPTADGS